MTEENIEFDFQQALKDMQEARTLLGKDGILTPLIKQLTKAALEAEIDCHLNQDLPVGLAIQWCSDV